MNLSSRLDLLRAQTAFQALEHVYVQPSFPNAQTPNGFLPVIISGGIGDLIMSFPLLDQIKSVVGKIKIWTLNPDTYRYFYGDGDLGEGKYFPGFSYWLKVQTSPMFYRNGKEEQVSKEHLPLFMRWMNGFSKNDQIERFSHYQPHFDGELAQAAIDAGLNRRTLPHFVMGFPTKNCDPALKPKGDISFDFSPFITVNDGVDATQTDIPYRSTKSWSLRLWADFVDTFKKQYPGHWVVQIGGKNSRPIPGVHVDFSGKMSIEQSLNLLAKSSLHVDTEGGLVHLAHAFGVRSVVIFGSTNKEFFSYSDNINLAPKVCGNCWWKTRSWMSQCPLFDAPRCADSIGSDEVMEAVQTALEGK